MSSATQNSQFDTQKADAFAGRVLGFLNGGAFCLMASLGHRSGLFDAMRDQPPMRAEEISARAGLNERYVREWLGSMVTAGVVEVDGEHGTFRLPPEHASALTRAAGADNIAVFAQYIGLLGSVEDDILYCFEHGGGVPYARFPRFHDVMAEDSGQSVLFALESHILPLVPGLVERLSAGIDVLDVGCGRGRIMTRLAVDHARSEAARRGLTNLAFVARDLSDFGEWAEPASFDFIATFDAVHDQAKPLNVLRGIRRALREGGVYLMQDIKGSSHVHENVGHPLGTLLYTVSCMHCMTVSLALDGAGLGAMWGEQKAREMLTEAGFTRVEVKRIEADPFNSYYIATKASEKLAPAPTAAS
jgi:SAM-dependent methyltransferase